MEVKSLKEKTVLEASACCEFLQSDKPLNMEDRKELRRLISTLAHYVALEVRAIKERTNE